MNVKHLLAAAAMMTMAGSALAQKQMTWVVPDAGFKPDRFQIGNQPFGCPAAFGFEGRIGRDGLDFQEIEKPLQAFIQIIIERIQHRFES